MWKQSWKGWMVPLMLNHQKATQIMQFDAICRSLIVTLNVQHIFLNLFPFRFFVSQRIFLVKSKDQSSRSCTTCLGLSQDGCLWPSLRWCCAGAGEASTFEEEHWPRWGDGKCGQVEVWDGEFSDFFTQKNPFNQWKSWGFGDDLWSTKKPRGKQICQIWFMIPLKVLCRFELARCWCVCWPFQWMSPWFMQIWRRQEFVWASQVWVE